MNRPNSPHTGVLCAVVSAACFATIPLFSSIAYESGASPIALLFCRFAIGWVFLRGIAFARHERFPVGRNRRKLIGLGSMGFVAQSICFFSSLQLIPGSLATILLYLYPAIVVCLLWLKGRTIDRAKFLALGLSLIGCYFVVSPAIEQSGGQAILGIALAIGAAIANAIYVVQGEAVLQEEEAIPAVAEMSRAAAIVYGIASIGFGSRFPSSNQGWVALLWIGIVCAAVAIGLLFESVKRLGSANASILSTLEPVIATAIGVWLLGDEVTIEKLLGGTLIIGAAILIARKQC